MPAPKELAQRLKTIRQGMKKNGLDGYFVLDRANTLYATGFRCSSSYALITSDEAFFLTDFRYIEAARKAIAEFEVNLQKDPLQDLARRVKRHRLQRVGVERNLPYGLALELQEKFAPAQLVANDAPIALARIRKSASEIELIREAVLRIDRAYVDLCGDVVEGWNEIEVRNRLRRMIERHGGANESFDAIVAAGPNASRPHAVPGDRDLSRGDVVQIDTGLIYQNYCSDLSRVMSIGRPSAKLRSIHQIVRDAQERAIEAIRPGVKASDIDARARDYIAKKGFGKNFGHGTGHGVGLEIHEAPTLKATSKDILEEGMIVTVEPGIYLPGRGGVRIEDNVVITENGAEILSDLPRDLITLG